MNNNIIRLGMNVHKAHFNLCCFDFETENFFCEVETKSDYKEIVKYLNKVKEIDGYQNTKFKLAYEAGSLGYSLYRDLIKENLDCVIMAPTTMSKSKKDIITSMIVETLEPSLNVLIMELILQYIYLINKMKPLE